MTRFAAHCLPHESKYAKTRGMERAVYRARSLGSCIMHTLKGFSAEAERGDASGQTVCARVAAEQRGPRNDFIEKENTDIRRKNAGGVL